MTEELRGGGGGRGGGHVVVSVACVCVVCVCCDVVMLWGFVSDGFLGAGGCSDFLLDLGNTILVKLKLWELVIVFNKTFWSATNLCPRYASAKCGS